MKTLTQILPQFEDVRLVPKHDIFARIYEANKIFKVAWLLDEDDSIWEFIELLDKVAKKNSLTTSLNLYELYIAYNVKFPACSVKLLLTTDSRVLHTEVKDFAGLLTSIVRGCIGKLVVLVKSPQLKLKILQQFIYLRMYLPIKVVTTFGVVKPLSQETGDVGIFGTKKAGKSALINALLGDEYAISSPFVPTPNKITYCEVNRQPPEILLTYKNARRCFHNVDALQNFLYDEFYFANQNSAPLDDMVIAVPNFPNFLQGTRLIDTPGSNFAAAKDHADVTQKALLEVRHAIFVINYSQHLTQDEIRLFGVVYRQFNNAKVQKPILVVINRVDEIFASEESKSYERITDYIHHRLTVLGYKNFFVVSVSALQSVYFDAVTRLLATEPTEIIELIENALKGNLLEPPSLSKQLQKLKDKYRNTDHMVVISFVSNTISNFKNFYDIELESVRDLQKINRVNYLKCLIHNLIVGYI